MKYPKTITKKFLVSIDACEYGINAFLDVFPNGARVTVRNVLKALDNGLDIEFIVASLPAGPRAIYEKAIAEPRAIYNKARSEAWAIYEKAAAEAKAIYEKAIAEPRAIYNKARSEAWAIYEKAAAEALVAAWDMAVKG